MKDAPLSLTEYAVLGLLADRPQSGYELDKRAASSVAYFWRPAKSKIYEILPRLVERGLASSTLVEQEGRPDKQIHRLTAAGRAALRAWVESDELPRRVARNPLLLKLFFGGYGDPAALTRQLAATRTAARAQLEELLEIERGIDKEQDFFPYLTLLHGIEDARSSLEWAEKALAALRARERAAAGAAS